MKKNIKKALGVVLLIAMILSSALSLSSCLQALDYIISDRVLGNIGNTNDGSNSADGSNSTGGNTDGESGNQGGSTDGESGNQGGSTDGESGNQGGSTDGESGSQGGSSDGESGSQGGSTDGESGNQGGSTDGESGNQGGSSDTDYLPDAEENANQADKLTSLNRALLSTVSIICSSSSSSGLLQPDQSAGSGVIYRLDKARGDAIIITNYHVVYNKNASTSNKICDEIKIYLYGQETSDYAISATYIGGSLSEDLAVLRISGSDVIKNSCARAAELGDSDRLYIFDKIYAVGNPAGAGMVATDGIISSDSEPLTMTGADEVTSIALRVMRVSAAINRGNSGGGIYDENGRLVGIVNAKKTGADVDNIAWAIPINHAKEIVNNILYYSDGIFVSSGYRCLLGVTLSAKSSGAAIEEESGRVYKKEVVEIVELNDDSMLTNPDLVGRNTVKVGDIITSVTVDGVSRAVWRTHHVIDLMYSAKRGSEVTLGIMRGETTFTVSLTIPDNAELVPIK